MAPPRGSTKNGLLTLGLGLLVVAVMLFAKLHLGRAPGEPCDGGLVCRGIPGRCLQPDANGTGYCTRPCEHTTDCPSGWTCETATWRSTAGAPQPFERVCVLPRTPSSSGIVDHP
jgi:hypothetical protein